MKNRCEFIGMGDYTNPPIPAGYRHVIGTTWQKGYMIERISDRSLFTWVPVGCLKANGTQFINKYNSVFDKKFGTRMSEQISERHTVETSGNLAEQLRSVEKYDGFYVSSYRISKVGDKYVSRSGLTPVLGEEYVIVRKIASEFENLDAVTSHLLLGCEFDTMWQWFWETIPNKDEVNECMQYLKRNDIRPIRKVQTTGSGYFINNIYDVIGGQDDWTQELRRMGYLYTFRDSYHFSKTDYGQTPKRRNCYCDNKPVNVGFRVALCIK